MEPDTTLVKWEITRVYEGPEYGVAHLVFGIVKRDLKGRLKEGDHILTTPLIDFNESNHIGRTIDATYRLEGNGKKFSVSTNDALAMRNIGISYLTLLTLKSKGLDPQRWYR